MKHTVATCAHLLATLQWTLIDVELDADTELDATAQRTDLGCAQRESGREAHSVAEHSARREAQGESGVRRRRREESAARGTR